MSLNLGGMADNVYKTLNYFIDEPMCGATNYTLTDDNRKITRIRALNSTKGVFDVSKKDRKRLGEFIDSLPSGTSFNTDTLFNVEFKPTNPKHKYKGKVYLLTSNYTFSAAQMFTQYFQEFNIGKVAGQPCAGYSVITGGNTDIARLPHDGDWMRFLIPTTMDKRYIGIDKYEYEKVDIEIERNFDEWLRDERGSLDKLIGIIKLETK